MSKKTKRIEKDLENDLPRRVITIVKQIKNLNDLKKQLNLTDEEINNCVNWVNLIEQHFFNGKTIDNYRNKAIDFCIENKIDFTVTQNNPFEMLDRFVRLVCPKCSQLMSVNKSSGGDTHTHHITYRCPNCSIEGSLRIDVPDGMSFHFKK
jgi:Zn finger protein HypA/HybF involved in hydrogenase expression